jgi:sulfoxide reductase heme-binding subunit YedZ
MLAWIYARIIDRHEMSVRQFQSAKSRIIWIKSGLFLFALLPLARLFWLGFHHSLTANPIEFVERSLGTWALVFLLVTLALTPIRMLSGMMWPIKLRRMTGLFMFFYACLHFLTYVWLDQSFDWAAIVKDIGKHPYVLVGFSAFVMSIPLAATSNKAMMKQLGKHWNKLHSLVYVIAILSVLHYGWLVKKDIREPLIYGLILLILLGIRLFRKSKLVVFKANIS